MVHRLLKAPCAPSSLTTGEAKELPELMGFLQALEKEHRND